MRRGFTLLELVVVIIIISILASIALGNYSRIVERSRAAEGKANLGMIRRLQVAFAQENYTYGSLADIKTYSNSSWPEGDGNSCTDGGHYFQYQCSATACSANRCMSGGKAPPRAAGVYTMSVDLNSGCITGDAP